MLQDHVIAAVRDVDGGRGRDVERVEISKEHNALIVKITSMSVRHAPFHR